MRAWRLPLYQVVAPGWLESERFDIAAKIPEGATKAEIDAMLQNLLAERFHLVVHRETREISGYDLVTAKKGSKLKETAFKDNAPPVTRTGPPKTDADGFPQLDAPGQSSIVRMTPKGAVAHLAMAAQPLQSLVNILSFQLKSPVVDRTGLTGKYDLKLEYAPGDGPAGDDSAPPIEVAIQEQLGLKLELKKTSVEILVMDKADKIPTEN